ncbi:MAG: NAD(P)-dependent oxidoreductase [Candidatus Ratteibacteria bacterium]
MHKNKRVLVLGATGEIGGRIAKGCVDAGYKVLGVSRGVNKRHIVNLDGVIPIYGNKRSPEFWKNIPADDFDVVIDSVPSIEDVELTYNHFKGKIQHYFICSSTGTYAPLLYYPADEKHPWQEETYVNFYPKSLRDSFALKLYEEEGFPVTIFRPTNIIGAGRVPLDLWGGRDIEYFRLLKAGKSIEVPGDGTTLVQSGYNDDLASAFVKGVNKGEEINGEIFIISCMKAITLNKYLETAKDILKSTSPVEYLTIKEIKERRPNSFEDGLLFLSHHMCFDIRKAIDSLGYSPTLTTEEGLESALKWCIDEGLLD